jgi:hypothetical protein
MNTGLAPQRRVPEDEGRRWRNTRRAALPVGLLIALAGGCGAAVADQGVPTVPSRRLRSERRLRFLLRAAGGVVAGPATTLPANLDTELPAKLAREMTDAGLHVEHDPRRACDVVMRLEASVAGAGSRLRARAALELEAEGRPLARLLTDEIVETRDGLASALARALVSRLVQSSEVSHYADQVYGLRIRPLQETVGRQAIRPGPDP